jgi:hypothetical protein
MTRDPLPWLLIGLVVLLLGALGITLPVGDTAMALAACLVGALIWRARLR